ncbi:MAG: XRE family transcriptional regulator [Actinobacteria bacterium]|nr:XRE family transcriptional regulator [Actinomycetota bacterium]
MAKTPLREFQELSDEVRQEPGAHEEIEERKAGIRAGLKLGELRQHRGQTQASLAGVLGTSQANVSRMERTRNVYLETLADYVEALGGRLEINAVFDDDDVVPLNVFQTPGVTPTR